MRYCLSIVSLKCWANEILLRKFFPMPVLCRALPVFSSSSSCGSDFVFRSLIILKLVYRYRSHFILLPVDIQFSQLWSLKTLSFLQYTILTPLSNIKWLKYIIIYLCLGLWICFIVPHVSFVPVPYCFYYLDFR